MSRIDRRVSLGKRRASSVECRVPSVECRTPISSLGPGCVLLCVRACICAGILACVHALCVYPCMHTRTQTHTGPRDEGAGGSHYVFQHSAKFICRGGSRGHGNARTSPQRSCTIAQNLLLSMYEFLSGARGSNPSHAFESLPPSDSAKHAWYM